MAFILNLFEIELDLSDKDHRKIFNDGSKGLKNDSDFFDGKKENFSDWSKLLEPLFKKARLMQCLKIPTEWDQTPGNSTAARAARRKPTVDGLQNIFFSHQVKRNNVSYYFSLVWANTTIGVNTPQYFARFATVPADQSALDTKRQQRRLRHVMLGRTIWESLTSKFQLEILVKKDQFTMSDEFDGALLWDFIRRHVNPTTTVGASNLKELIEKAVLSEYSYDIKVFNMWFESTRSEIIKEEGPDQYKEYLRQLFRAYETHKSKRFLDAVAEEKRRWEQGKLGASYTYRELLELGRVTFNNLSDKEKEITSGEEKENKDGQAADEKGEAKFLALATSILQTMKDGGFKSNGGKGSSGGSADSNYKDQNGKPLKMWRFENPENAQTKELNGRTMRWCTNDCHPKPMWCGRKNCLNKADFARKMEEREKGGTEKKDSAPGGAQYSKDFKIALAAMMSAEDFKAIKSQFMQGK